MKRFIKLSQKDRSYKKYLVDPTQIDLVADFEDTLGSRVYLKDKTETLSVSESAERILEMIPDTPQEQTPTIRVLWSLFCRK